MWSAAVEGWKAGVGTLYIFGAGLQGRMEDGRDLISRCRKKEGRKVEKSMDSFGKPRGCFEEDSFWRLR
jgi:hypothetical protein